MQLRVTRGRVTKAQNETEKHQQDDTTIVSKEEKPDTDSKQRNTLGSVLIEVLKCGRVSFLLSENKFNIPKQRARERGILKTLDLTTVSELWISLKH